MTRTANYTNYELIRPPQDSKVGERVRLLNHTFKNTNTCKSMDNVNTDFLRKLERNWKKEVSFRGVQMKTSAGPIKVGSYEHSEHFL